MSQKTKPTTKRRSAKSMRKVVPRFEIRLEAKTLEVLAPDDRDGRRVIRCDLTGDTYEVPLGGAYFVLAIGEDDMAHVQVHPTVLAKGPDHLQELIRKKVFRMRDNAHHELEKADALEHYAEGEIKPAWPYNLFS